MTASSFGFLPENDGIANAVALQKAIDTEHDVSVELPGEYDVAGSVFLPSHCHLTFASGVILVRQPDPSGKNGYFFVNRGAFDGTFNEDISIEGLTLRANGVESDAAKSVPKLPDLIARGEDALNDAFSSTVVGLRGHLAFLYVKDLVIRNFSMNDLCEWDFCIHVSDFENILMENIAIEGNKDAIHFGPGSGFVLRNCAFRTKDDPIALNADDYSPSAPTVGVIENGLIENCVDLNQDSTVGYFIRFILGTAISWKAGMTVRHSDSVLCGGKFYRAILPPDGTEKISYTQPTHEHGIRVLDGIPWIRTSVARSSDELSDIMTVRNVTFRNITAEKTRGIAVIAYIADNRHHRGWREGAPVPVMENITFENFTVQGNVKKAFEFCVPVKNITVRNSDLGGGSIRFEQTACGLGTYPASFCFDNVTNFRFDDGDAFCSPEDGQPDYFVKY